ncbi:hypothetical protein BTS2_2975 [Bacillus sp. TS-2]|nr:hypothetical protein BTS2_2975 [Bacillus sp. TS-2]
MNMNQKAIEMFEQNESEKALELFQQAVKESSDVQSLNNLAWFYLYEEEKPDRALELIEMAVESNPSSYFPYNILGEIYLEQKHWKKAIVALQKSISINPSNEAHHNIAVAYYHLGEFELAAAHFLQAAKDSDIVMFYHIKCLIDLGRTTESKEKLDAFNKKADDFVGEIEVADLYIELGCYNEAIHWFEKGYDEYAKTPNWIGRFVYCLFKTNQFSRIDEVIQKAIEIKEEEIKDVQLEEIEENWTEADKNELIEEYTEELYQYKKMVEVITSGYVPPLEFETHSTGSCYLFGCKTHQHPEYEE